MNLKEGGEPTNAPCPCVEDLTMFASSESTKVASHCFEECSENLGE